jgi:hypothetical protein
MQDLQGCAFVPATRMAHKAQSMIQHTWQDENNQERGTPGLAS